MIDRKRAFSEPSQIRWVYPEKPGILHHNYARHHYFALDDLVALAATLTPEQVEWNRGDLPIGVDPAAIPGNGLSVADTIRSIEENGSWMVLKNVESHPIYAEMMENALYEIMGSVDQCTGEMHQMEGFIFVSSPNAVTPLHFDPEHNILMQIRGSKTMYVFPHGDEAIAPNAAHEAFQLGKASRNLVWQDDFAVRGHPFELRPGEGLYVPVMAPHWVKNGPELSVSFSITWRSEWSYRAADAHAFNAVLRRMGLNPRRPKRWPAQNKIKSTAWRALRKSGFELR
jgi:Cupin-like domain